MKIISVPFLIALFVKIIQASESKVEGDIDADKITSESSRNFTDLDPEGFYNLIIRDQCNPMTMTSSYIRQNGLKSFDDIDLSNSNRIPLHVAIDNKSLKCIRYIIKHFCAASTIEETLQREQELLQWKDLRGWRAIEHAIENYPYVESLVFPSGDLGNPEDIDKLAKFALRSNPLRSLSFLVNLTTRLPHLIDRIRCVLVILEELLLLPEPSSQRSLMFVEQFLEGVRFTVMAEGFDLSEQMKTFFKNAVDKKCVLVLRRKELIFCLNDADKKELIRHAISKNRPIMAREIYETWKELDSDSTEYLDFLGELYEELLPKRTNDSSLNTTSNSTYTYTTAHTTEIVPSSDISYLKTLPLAFFAENLEKEILMIKLEDFEALSESERIDYCANIPKLLQDVVPSALLIALHNPAMVDSFYAYRPELFTDFLHLIACYAPDSLPRSNLSSEQIKDSLAFVTSSRGVCNATATMKSRCIRNLLNRADHVKFATANVKLGWEIIHPLLYEATCEDLLTFIDKSIKYADKALVLGAAQLLNEPIPYTTLLKFLNRFGESALDRFIKLLGYGQARESSEMEQEIQASLEIKRILSAMDDNNLAKFALKLIK